MDASVISFLILLSIVWFLLYWTIGGVFFAVVAIARLGRVRKVRFSCLFTLWSLLLGVGAAVFGYQFAQGAVEECLSYSETTTELAAAVFGCGFIGVLGAFAIGFILLVAGGFLIMAMSKSDVKSWITLEREEQSAESTSSDEGNGSSKFF